MTRLHILVVSPKAETIRTWIKGKANEYYNSIIHIAMNGVEGLHKAQKFMPVLIIADNNLPDMNGMSFASVIKGTIECQDSKILVFDVKPNSILSNTKADFFLPVMDERQLKIFITAHIDSFFQNQYVMAAHRDEYESRKMEQLNQLPKQIDNNWVRISNIFSPYDELSGDGFDYWISPQSNTEEGVLYGFLYDCTGHGPESYPLVSSIRSLLKKNLRMYEFHRFPSLSCVMSKANDTIMDTTPSNTLTPAAAVTFYVNFKDNKLKYCPAGIPSFFVRYIGEDGYEKIECRNYLLGMFPNASFDEQEMSLTGVDELVFSSDGFSEILYHQDDDSSKEAKHDDVSAVTIQLKRPNLDKEMGV
ncbi:MAG: response regulator [Selenomonas sp.]|nr:response regulator [Selenomonas sp.]